MRIVVYRTVVQTGWQKAGPLGSRGEVVLAYYGTPTAPGDWTSIVPGQGEGVDLHARTKKPYRWWLADIWLAEGDLLKISTKVGVLGSGQDEDRTMDLLFSIDPSVGVTEVSWPGIGFKDYPLARGCLREISRTSAATARVVHMITPVLDGAGESKTIGEPEPAQEGQP